MSAVEPLEPVSLMGFKYRVTLGETTKLGFSKVSGLQATVGEMIWEEINDPATGVKLPDRITLADVTLERGVDKSSSMYAWYSTVLRTLRYQNDKIFRRTVTIEVLPKGEGNGKKFKMFEAWPKVMRWSDLDAGSSGIFIESLTLAHEGIVRLPG